MIELSINDCRLYLLILLWEDRILCLFVIVINKRLICFALLGMYVKIFRLPEREKDELIHGSLVKSDCLCLTGDTIKGHKTDTSAVQV